MLIGFGTEDDWFDFRLEHDVRFRRRLEAASKSIDEGRGTRLKDLKAQVQRATGKRGAPFGSAR
jgi:hypothetical protein